MLVKEFILKAVKSEAANAEDNYNRMAYETSRMGAETIYYHATRETYGDILEQYANTLTIAKAAVMIVETM